MPAPTESQIGGHTAHERHFRLLECMMKHDLPEQLREVDQLGDMCRRIQLFPSMGGFLGFQMALDLNMVPGLRRPEDWAVPGPGAQSGLRHIFGKEVVGHYGKALEWLFEHQERLFKRAGVKKKDIPAVLPSNPGLTLVDLEHALCETHKYITIRLRGPGGYASRVYKPNSTPVTRVLPPRWKETALAIIKREEKYNRPSAEVATGNLDDSQWLISHIVEKASIAGELHYRVRWKGYEPEEDTWEPSERLKEDAAELVDEYERIVGGIEKTLTDYRCTI